MEKIPATDRTDFTLCKKAPNGNRPQPIRDRFRIVVQPAEQALPSTTAAEDQCAQGGIVVRGAICRQQQVQILAGRLGVSQVKLDRLALLHDIPDRNGPGDLISADKIADQKISPFKMIPLFVHYNADVQGSVGAATVVFVQRFKHRL